MNKAHQSQNMIQIARPYITEKERRVVLRVLNSGMLAQGKRVKEFEEKFAKFIGTKYAIATSSGTTALHSACLALGLKKGDEVITTSFSFIASANGILYTGAKPVFVDINEETYNIDPKLIESQITKKTKAILIVHLYGNPCQMDKIIALTQKYHLILIEDACQAHGSSFDDKRTGSFGTGCFSFYATKNMTTGEGGMVTTNNPEIADKIRLLRSHGSEVEYYSDFLGYNFRMTDIQAAMGIEQLKKLPKFNQKRIENANYLTERLKDTKGVITPTIKPGVLHVFHQYTIRVTEEYPLTRDQLMDVLRKKGVFQKFSILFLYINNLYTNGWAIGIVCRLLRKQLNRCFQFQFTRL